MKTTRLRIGLIAVLLAIALAAYWMFLRPPEDPICKGVPLSEWLVRSGWDQGRPPIKPEDLRAITSKSVPFLSYYLRSNCPRNKKSIAARMPNWLQKKLPPTWIETKVVGSSEGCQHALDALVWLGADAEPALQTLVMLQNHSDGMLGVQPARAIHLIGPSSWPAVLEVWHSGSVVARQAIVRELPRRFQSPAPFATEAEKKLAIDLLLEAFRDPDPKMQNFALQSLEDCREGRFGASPLFDPAILVLIRCMEKGKGYMPAVAAITLSHFPEHARMIIPALKKMEASSNRGYSVTALLARHRIEITEGAFRPH